MESALRSRYDVIVVGARVAGAATALLLARQGLSVLVVDRSPPGADTLSTLALMRGGVLQLQRWGLLDRLAAAGTPPVRKTTFHYGDEDLEVAIKPRGEVQALYAPRRTVLDPMLAQAAREAGADVRYGLRLVDLLRREGRVTGVVVEETGGASAVIEAGIVIGADGLRSAVARLVGARPYRVGQHATALVYGHWADLPLEGYHWYYRPGVSAGAIPTNHGLTCVFVAVPPARFHREVQGDLGGGYQSVLAQVHPGLAALVSRARPVGALRGFAGERGYFRRSWGPGWALVGDAAYFKDPLTAHGMTDALRDAELLARAVGRGGAAALAEVEATRDALSVGLFEVTDAIASFAWDLPTVKAHHRVLSQAMAGEVAFLAGLDAAGQVDAGAVAN